MSMGAMRNLPLFYRFKSGFYSFGNPYDAMENCAYFDDEELPSRELAGIISVENNRYDFSIEVLSVSRLLDPLFEVPLPVGDFYDITKFAYDAGVPIEDILA